MGDKDSAPLAAACTKLALLLFGAGLAGLIGGSSIGLGSGLDVGLRCGLGGMLGGVGAGLVSLGIVWVLSGTVVPWAFFAAVGLGVAGGAHAARDGAILAGIIGTLAGSALCGLIFGTIASRGAPLERPRG